MREGRNVKSLLAGVTLLVGLQAPLCALAACCAEEVLAAAAAPHGPAGAAHAAPCHEQPEPAKHEGPGPEACDHCALLDPALTAAPPAIGVFPAAPAWLPQPEGLAVASAIVRVERPRHRRPAPRELRNTPLRL